MARANEPCEHYIYPVVVRWNGYYWCQKCKAYWPEDA